MRRSCLTLFILLLVSFNVVSQEGDAGTESVPEKEIEVALGIDKIVKLDFIPSPKIQVGNESVLTYQLIPQKREITFKGLKPEKTSVIIRNTVGDIKARFLVKVTSTDQTRVVSELREFLGDIEGLEIGIKGGKVVIEGEIIVPDKIGEIDIILQKYPDVISLIELSPQTQRVIAQKMQDEIHRNGMRDVTVRIVNKVFWLEGVVPQPEQKELALKLAEGYLPDRLESLSQRSGRVQQVQGRKAILNFIVVNEKKAAQPIPKIVKIVAQFVELSKDYGKIFGFSWTPILAGSGGQINIGKTTTGEVTTESKGTLSATISNLFPKLASAKSAGQARVIQSAMVLTQNGIEASISKSSTEPFTLGTGEFTKAESSKTGLDLKIKPTVLEGEKIDLRIGLSITVESGATTEGKPRTTENKVSTAVVVNAKESAAIGGVVFNSQNTDFDKDPPGGAVQVEDGASASPLFSFVRSKNFSQRKSQFVVFVTPELVESASQGSEEIRRKFKRRR